jgi:hypothetical protein
VIRVLAIVLLSACAASIQPEQPESLYSAGWNGHRFDELVRRPRVSIVELWEEPGTKPDGQAGPFFAALHIALLGELRGYTHVVRLGSPEIPSPITPSSNGVLEVFGFTNTSSPDIAAEFPLYFDPDAFYEAVATAELLAAFGPGEAPANKSLQRMPLTRHPLND